MYTPEVDQILQKNEEVLKAFFEKFLFPDKQYINLEECITILYQTELKIDDSRINPCFVESMMAKVDTMSDLASLDQMKYEEFLVFLARVSHESYQNSPESSWACHLKIDKVLDAILATQKMSKAWGFS